MTNSCYALDFTVLSPEYGSCEISICWDRREEQGLALNLSAQGLHCFLAEPTCVVFPSA